jgi:hypothetical protein
MGLVPEREKLFQTLTVRENLEFNLTRTRQPARPKAPAGLAAALGSASRPARKAERVRANEKDLTQPLRRCLPSIFCGVPVLCPMNSTIGSSVSLLALFPAQLRPKTHGLCGNRFSNWAAHQWVVRFFWGWVTDGLRAAPSPQRAIPSVSPTYDLDGMVFQLLGFDSRMNKLGQNLTFGPAVAGMEGVLARAEQDGSACPRS